MSLPIETGGRLIPIIEIVTIISQLNVHENGFQVTKTMLMVVGKWGCQRLFSSKRN